MFMMCGQSYSWDELCMAPVLMFQLNEVQPLVLQYTTIGWSRTSVRPS